jgi:ligand-binding SRPBCC domain-containing protein
VTDLDRPRRFVDQQVRGPFRRFHHEHVFESGGGGTLMIDRVSLDAPVGLIGRVVERLVLGRYLEQLIETRGRLLKTEAEKRHRAES